MMEHEPRSPDAGALPDGAVEWSTADAIPTEPVKELFVTLEKTMRAFQLYDDNNPVYQRFEENLTAAFAELWTEVDRLSFMVSEQAFHWLGAEVYRNENRVESLAFLCFKDGIRELTFLPGVEEEELSRFIGVLLRARSFREEGEDLLTVLWDEGFEHIRYQYIDLLSEGVALPEASEEMDTDLLRSVWEGEVGQADAAVDYDPTEEDEEEEPAAEEAPERRSGAASVADQVQSEGFNPTLYSLTSSETAELKAAMQDEIDRDVRHDVLSALLDRLEEPEYRDRQIRILEILTDLLPRFLSRGDLRNAGYVLGALSELRGAGGVFDEAGGHQIDALEEALSAPSAVTGMIEVLQAGTGSREYSIEELRTFFSTLRPSALDPILRAGVATENKALKRFLQEAAIGVARRDPSTLVEILKGEDSAVVSEAVLMIPQIGMQGADSLLSTLLRHQAPTVRLAAVEAAIEMRAASVAQALEPALRDPDRLVRIAAARGLGTLQYRPAEKRLKDVVTGAAIKSADLTEQIAFFEAYGMVAAEGAVGLLHKILNGKGFLGRREASELRACAALALGKIQHSDARNSLMAARNDEDAVVRNAVRRALDFRESSG